MLVSVCVASVFMHDHCVWLVCVCVRVCVCEYACECECGGVCLTLRKSNPAPMPGLLCTHRPGPRSTSRRGVALANQERKVFPPARFSGPCGPEKPLVPPRHPPSGARLDAIPGL